MLVHRNRKERKITKAFWGLQELEGLCQSLAQLAESLRARSQGEQGGPEVPGSLDAELGAARTALQTELAAFRTPAKKMAAKQSRGADKETQNEASVMRAAWRALLALQGQLELAKRKRVEFEAALSGTAGAASS